MGSYRIEKVFEEYRPALQELRVIIGELAEFESQVREHGEIEKHLQRLGCSDHGVGSVFPLDVQLNLPLRYYSHGLRERVGEAVASGSYEAAIEQIARHTGGHIPKRQAEEVSQGLAVDFEEFYRRREPAQKEGTASRELVVLSMDGKGIVVMRHEDLREHTRQRAEGACHKSQSERAPLDKCAEYLLKNRERLKYAQALKEGLPIATGVVEGACRHLVKQRMECSGARWSLKGAEAVLQLRALRMSGDWDDYIAFHQRAERLRNHPACDDLQRKAA